MTVMRLILFALITLVFSTPSSACINEYGVDIHGREHHSTLEPVYFRPFNKTELLNRLGQLESQLKNRYSYKDYSDYGVNLLKIGKTKEALLIFQRLINVYPNEYEIAANLGTAYELVGAPALALKWISRSMRLNPGAHSGSEWVHLAILRTKLELQKDQKWLNNHTVLPVPAPGGSVWEYIGHIEYQLRERIPFTPSRDVLLSQLLTELGAVEADKYSITEAVKYYQLAMFYNPARGKELQAIIAGIKSTSAAFPKDKRKVFDNSWINQFKTVFNNYNPLLIASYKPLVLDRTSYR